MNADERWEYKGHQILTWDCGDDECTKIMHDVTLPNGELKVANVSPYAHGQEIVRQWIDLGYPERGFAPFDKDEISAMIAECQGHIVNGRFIPGILCSVCDEFLPIGYFTTAVNCPECKNTTSVD